MFKVFRDGGKCGLWNKRKEKTRKENQNCDFSFLFTVLQFLFIIHITPYFFFYFLLFFLLFLTFQFREESECSMVCLCDIHLNGVLHIHETCFMRSVDMHFDQVLLQHQQLSNSALICNVYNTQKKTEIIFHTKSGEEEGERMHACDCYRHVEFKCAEGVLKFRTHISLCDVFIRTFFTCLSEKG